MKVKVKQPTVLYSSKEVHAAIKSIFRDPGRQDRRVAIVAYLGRDASRYLPNPKDMHIVCMAAPIATSHTAILELDKKGARVEFADRLHMKVYWSSVRGSVITSANVSSSALGRGGLKEAGVLFPPNAVDIDRLMKQANPKAISATSMDRLDKESKRVRRRLGRTRVTGFDSVRGGQRTYLQWYGDNPEYRQKWKLGWWDVYGEFGRESVAQSTRMYDDPEPGDFTNFKKGQVSADDWVLTFRITDGGAKKIDWMYVDFVARLSKEDGEAFDKEYPYQAVQVHDSSYYPNPPFGASQRPFVRAFSNALKSFGLRKVRALDPPFPTQDLLDLVAEHYHQSAKKR